MCLMAAFVPHRPNKYFHASNGTISNSPYTPLAIMTASPIASVSKLSTMQMSSRYVRCAPNAVDDRTPDHHADRSSVLGTCFWPLIVRYDAPIAPSIAGTAVPLAAASYRASGLEAMGCAARAMAPSSRQQSDGVPHGEAERPEQMPC